jgi:hypothetical protein
MKVRKLGGFVSFVRFGHSTESAQHAIALSRVMHPQERERERRRTCCTCALPYRVRSLGLRRFVPASLAYHPVGISAKSRI